MGHFLKIGAFYYSIVVGFENTLGCFNTFNVPELTGSLDKCATWVQILYFIDPGQFRAGVIR